MQGPATRGKWMEIMSNVTAGKEVGTVEMVMPHKTAGPNTSPHFSVT